MKWDFLQADFSAGELSPKLQGAIALEAYKAGLSRAANACPTRGKSVASRAGGAVMSDPITGHCVNYPAVNPAHGTPGPGAGPVQHLAIPDGPRGPVVAEIGPRYVRLLDRNGIQTWHQPFDLTLDGKATDGVTSRDSNGAWTSATDFYNDVWGDKKSNTLYVNNSTGVGQRDISTAFQNNFEAIGGTPAGTDGSWNFYYRLAGDPVTLRVELGTGETTDYVLTRGAGVVNFAPRRAPADVNTFKLHLLSANGAISTSTLWDLRLAKNSEQFAADVFPASVSKYLNRARVSQGFWFGGQFYAIVVGLGALYTFRWTDQSGSGLRQPEWEFVPLNFAVNGSYFAAADVTSVAVYQNRVWLGMGDNKGTLFASKVGYGDSTNVPGGSIFVFGRVENDYTGDGVKQDFFFYANAGVAPTGGSLSDLLYVSIAGAQQASAAFLTTPRYDANGVIYAMNVHIVAGPPALGQAVVIRRADNTVVADDPLDLKLATPMGSVVWFAVLHGLVLGSTRAERTFENVALTVDPATGGDFSLLDHSTTGSDPALPAIPVNEKILHLAPGRRILRSLANRYLWDNGLPQGGLISDDVSAVGEHLLSSRVRSFCYVKSPVERLVFAFDDGTGAIATMNAQFGLAWSRFTVPACFGGIFSVCSLDVGDGDAELYVGTDCGVTLFWPSLESVVTHKTLYDPGSLGINIPATHTLYDDETPLPPVMDGWVRAPLVRSGNDLALSGSNGGAGVTGRHIMPLGILNGQQMWLLFAGQVFGPFTVAFAGGLYILQNAWTALAAAGFTDSYKWTDATHAPRAGECYVGIAYAEHRATTLVLEGGNPRGTAQAYKSRKPQLYVRFVDSYVPKVNGNRTPEMDGQTTLDLLAKRWTADLRFTELGFTRGAVVDIVMEVPLRMEFSAIFGGTQTQSV